MPVCKGPAHVLTVLYRGDPVPVLGQEASQEIAYLAIVVDDQYVSRRSCARCTHGGKISPVVAVIAKKFVTDHNRRRTCDSPLPNAALPVIGPLQRIITWMVLKDTKQKESP